MTWRPWWADDPDIEVGTKSGPIPDWPADDEPVVVPQEFIPSGEDEGHADQSEMEPIPPPS